MKIGDLVKTVRGYSESGLVVNIIKAVDVRNLSRDLRAMTMVTVLWPDHGLGVERQKDLKVVS